MRRNLVNMLDGIGLPAALGIDTSDQLFNVHHNLAALCSVIDYPIFVNGTNYGAATQELTSHPVLRSLARACLGRHARGDGT